MTTDDEPVCEPALDESGLDRPPYAVHIQRTVGRHIRSLDEDSLTHLDRVLLPILQWLARERPPKAGPVLLGLWQLMARGRLNLEVRKLLWHLVTRWNNLMCSQRHPDIPASTHRFGRFKLRARLARGLKTKAGPRYFVGLMACGIA